MSSFLAWQKAPSWEMAAHWEDLRERERKNTVVSIRSQLVLGTGCSQDGGKVWALPKARSDLNESVYGSFMFFFFFHLVMS